MRNQINKSFILLFAGFCFSGCNHLLYPASRYPYTIPSQISPTPKEIRIPVQGNLKNETLHAWLFESPKKTKKGIVVHFHGNGQNLTTHFMFFKWMILEGYDYLIFDYRGYGASSGEQATQQKTVEDGLSVFQFVRADLNNLKVIAIGQSLGSAVLARTLQEIAKKKDFSLLPDVAVFDSAFLSYQMAARSILSQRWFLSIVKPLTYVAISDEWAAKKIPVDQPLIPALFFHGNRDSVIKYDLGRDAFENWKGPKFFYTDDGGGHTSAFGDQRFVENKSTLIRCLDLLLKSTDNLEACKK